LKAVAMAALCLFLLAGFLFTRYGNEDMDYMTVNEVTGVRAMYDMAPSGSLFVGAWQGAPWQFKDYEKYTLDTLFDTPQLNDFLLQRNVSGLAQFMQKAKQPQGNGYLLFTRSESVTYEATSGEPPADMAQFEQSVRTSGYFILVYSNPDTQIFKLASTKGGGSS
jgi:hypothetical protein